MTGSVFRTSRNITLLVISILLTACSPDKLSSNNTELSELSMDTFTFDQFFQSDQHDYTASVGYLAKSVLVIPVVEDSNASVTVNGTASSSTGTRVSLNEGDNTITIVVTAANNVNQQTYTIAVRRDTLSEFAEDAYVKSFYNQGSDIFGISVAVSENLLVVGAPGEDSGSSGVNSLPDESVPSAGAVFVFSRSSGYWVPEAYLKASNPGDSDMFGVQVALSGDTLAVSAYSEDSNSSGINSTVNDDGNADNSGAVYVFVRDSDGYWEQQAYIKAANPGADDYFGASLDIDGDTLVVGAILEDSNSTGINSTVNDDGNANESGAVYVFTRDENDSWSQQAYLKPSNTGSGDQFGFQVALSQDTLAAGAPFEDSNSTGINSTVNDDGSADSSGAVYIFTRDSDNNWSQQSYIKASNTGAGDEFGRALDVDNNSLAVVAPMEDSISIGINSTPNDTATNFDSGAVYVFIRDTTGSWSSQAYIKAPFSDLDYRFGNGGVALFGDSLAVGSPRDDSNSFGINSTPNDDGNAEDSGATYVFTRATNGNWTQKLYLKSLNTAPGDFFGFSPSLYGDTLAIGLPGEDSNSFGVNDIYFDDGLADDSGAVYVYE